MGEFIGHGRKARRAYGFDEVAIVPGTVTINPDDVDVSWTLGEHRFEIPFIASAMDGVVDPRFAIEMGMLGGFGVLNLDGIQTRYEEPSPILEQIVTASPSKVTVLLQKLYREPVKESLIAKRISEIKRMGVPAVVSAIPQSALMFAEIARDAGADIVVVQATVITAKHRSTRSQAIDFAKLCSNLDIPVIIGNCVTYEAALELMRTGPAGLLVGIGPGAACTTREVLGIGVPQVTATIDVVAARDFYYKKTKRYVSIITDGGMNTGGDVCKAFASGADAVMLGSAFARASEAPGKGYHWGMATPDRYLPRGTRIKVGITGTLKEILFGPARLDDGTQNIVGALRTSMGNVGAKNIRELQRSELVIAPEIKTEGKVFQEAQRRGMVR
jgi:IMP dehydrogenase